MIIVSIGLFIILLNIYINKKIPRGLFNSYTLLTFIWLMWGLLSYFWVVDYSAWTRYNNYIYLGFSYTILTSYVLSEKENLRGIFNIIIFSLIIHNIIGFFEIITGKYIFTSNDSISSLYSLLGYPTSFFYNTNDFATYLLLGIVVLVYYEPNENLSKVKLKAFNFIRITLIATSLYLTFASRIIVLTSLGVIILAAYLNFNNKNFKAILIPIIIVMFSYLIYLFTSNIDLLARSLREDPSGNTRLILIKNGIDLLKITNFRGVGSGNLEYYLSSYQQYGVATINVLHNWWIEVLATYGAVFFFYYIAFILRKILIAYRIVLNTKNPSAKFCLTWLLAIIPGAMVSSSIFDEVWFWVINAIVFVLLSNSFQRLTKSSESSVEEL
ncbi:O-antigen ligase family protein [Fundicoccus sp. Sow4_F4]|uniref:O-antigen ligase family protein n=1 Tax=Fundicoccus sp. Sow4_F4 TaxID=3438783 RepID=UPI003F928B71